MYLLTVVVVTARHILARADRSFRDVAGLGAGDFAAPSVADPRRRRDHRQKASCFGKLGVMHASSALASVYELLPCWLSVCFCQRLRRIAKRIWQAFLESRFMVMGLGMRVKVPARWPGRDRCRNGAIFGHL